MSRCTQGPSTGAGQHALAGLTLLSACTIAGAWLSFAWPHPEAAHAALPEPAPPLPAASTPGHVLLAEFETRAAAPSAHDEPALQLAAAHIHGRVLAPHEVFDFNASAPACTRGCMDQLASTLHAAAFFAGLPILERAPQARPSFYIKVGLEAAVRPGTSNLRFRNDRSFPLQLELERRAGRVRAALRGTARELRVSLIRDVQAIAPMPEHSELDPSLPRGMRVLTRRGIPGFAVQMQRVIHDDAQQRSLYERNVTRYPATEQLWRIGMANAPAPSFVRPRNDPQPEYVADEHLEMTQEPPGTFAVRRDAGRTGSYGWTAREGLIVRRE